MTSEIADILEQLRQENQTLRAQVVALGGTNQQLRQELQTRREQLDQTRRVGARQAAPFRRPERTKVPAGQKKAPGRKPGHPGSCRAVPAQVDEHAEVPLPHCPGCGGPLTQVESVEQFLEDLPPRRPHVTRLVSYKAACPPP